MINKIRKILQATGRPGRTASARQRRRRIVEAWQKIKVTAERGDQPVVPGSTFRGMVRCPGQMGADRRCADGAHAVDRRQYALVFTRTKPLDKAQPTAGHATSPCASSSRFAWSPRSRAVELA